MCKAAVVAKVYWPIVSRMRPSFPVVAALALTEILKSYIENGVWMIGDSDPVASAEENWGKCLQEFKMSSSLLL